MNTEDPVISSGNARYNRYHHQRALGIEQPVSVLWAALREHLSAEELAAVEAAYRRQSQRYQRAVNLNQLARWVDAVERRGGPRPPRVERYEWAKAALAEPMKYVEGE